MAANRLSRKDIPIMISQISALFPTAAGNSTDNGRTGETSLRTQVESGFASLFGQRASGADYGGGAGRTVTADRNSSGNRNDIIRANSEPARSRSAERTRGDRNQNTIRPPEQELPKNEVSRSSKADKSDKSHATNKAEKNQSRQKAERAENGGMKQADKTAESGNAEATDSTQETAQADGTTQSEGQQSADGQTQQSAEESSKTAAANAKAEAAKLAALEDPAAALADLPALLAAEQTIDPDAIAEGEALSGDAALTLNLALEDGEGGKAAARPDAHSPLTALKGGVDPKQLAAQQAQQAGADPKAATLANAGNATDSFAAKLAASAGATNGTAGISTVTGANATGGTQAAQSGSGSAAQQLTTLANALPGQTPVNGARAGAVQQLPVYTPAGQKGWADDVGVRLVWMAHRNEGKAELVLTPPNMGKLGVTLHMNGDQVTAQFVTATAATRDMLEQALPRLREILQQSNIQLAQADVSAGNNPQQFFQSHAGNDAQDGTARRGSRTVRMNGRAGENEDSASAVTLRTGSAAALMGNGAVDTFV